MMAWKRDGSTRQRLRHGVWREQRGTQLLELALMLPLLLVIAVGAIDFAAAYVLKQKLTNAARDGARIAVEQSMLDLSQPAPSTVQAIRNAIVNYMANAGIDVSAVSTSPAKTGPAEWTYAGGGAEIIIDRGVVIPVPSGGVTTATQVTVRYPFTWTFAQVIQLMIQPPPSYSNTITISANVVMKNLT
jgi:Flp pilus assembly protein TadG